MADHQPIAERLLTGDDVITEVLRNCEEGAFRIRSTTLLPSIYQIYLHPSDYDAIRPILTALVAESRQALTEKLEELKRRARPSAFARKLGFDGGKQTEYKILDPDWTIEFQPDVEDRLKRGEIEIYSELASAPRPEFEGEKTRVLTRRGDQKSYVSGSETTRIVSSPDPQGQTVYATLTFEDGNGQRTFTVTKDRVVIGRGGKSYWVDVKLSGPPDISREHCRIRRDAGSGRFFLKDVSQYGVTVDGNRVPSSIEDRAGDQRDINVEVPLPQRCVIGLAEVLFLTFEAHPQP